MTAAQSLPCERILSFLCISALFLAACAGQPEQPEAQDVVLATVAGDPITLSAFTKFSALIPEGMRKGDTLLDKNRQILNSLIDKRLLLAEAEAIQLADDPALQAELAFFAKNRLLDLYTQREIVQKIVVTDEEMEAHYRATHRDRALRFSGIMLKTRAEAEEILQAVADGAQFMELAKGRSLHRDSGEQGGDVGGYKLKDKVLPAIAEAIFPLAVGEVSEPIRFQFAGKPHYTVFQVTDEMPLPLAAAELKVREEVFGRKRAVRYQALLDSLKGAYGPELHPEQIRHLNQHSQQIEGDLYALPAALRNESIVSFRGGQISCHEFIQMAREMRAGRPELADSARVVFLLETAIIPAFLFAAEARAHGLAKNPDLRQRISDKRDDLLLNALRQRYVDQHVTATPEEARAFYDSHPEKFTAPLTTEVVEILVSSDSLALRLKRELLAGADPASLARTHTLRPGADHHDGHLTLSPYTKAYYQGIYDLAHSLPVGQVGGPVQVQGGYSVFKVLDRHEKKHPYDATSRRRATAYVKIDKSKRGYVRYVRSLREQYPVEESADAIERALGAPN